MKILVKNKYGKYLDNELREQAIYMKHNALDTYTKNGIMMSIVETKKNDNECLIVVDAEVVE